ncbi:hypothetical protein [Leptolyngbya sp. FACHB-261]|uniref:hypothetical protein n=1 Tax=Leptolyngbya sp. FACHB-261 TaxID=2692806 RepID=UPI0016840EF6|nr:hypothetical protein [Leptolyngbya sp. FACHB-261]MBD2103720.1 hypothetical protein [Leptolyngbya sp. FACHB-261]
MDRAELLPVSTTDSLTGSLAAEPLVGSFSTDPLLSLAPDQLNRLVTIANFTWRQINSANTARVVGGSVDSFFLSAFAQSTDGAVFEFGATVGRLLGYTTNNPDQAQFAVSAALPDEATPGRPTPNVSRTTLELTWGQSRVLANNIGRDFVVYEAGNQSRPEAFAVSVRRAGQQNFTPFRYEFADSFEVLEPGTGFGTFATSFDLSSFGLKLDESIDAIRIRSVSNGGPLGADRILGIGKQQGQGQVVSLGQPNYEIGSPLRVGPLGAGGPKGPSGTYTTAYLDADITYVAGLGNVLFRVAGFNFNQGNTTTTASLVRGSVRESFFNAFGQGISNFNFSGTTGQLLGNTSQPNFAVAAGLAPGRQPTILQSSWGGRNLRNRPGDDFVIYESGDRGNPEAFAVSVRRTGETGFTRYRYEFADSFQALEGNAGVFATAFDLSSFGIEPGSAIDAIRIQTLLSTSRVSEAGQGIVRVNGSPLSTGPLGPGTFAPSPFTGDFDPDITYITALHPLA